MSTDPTPRRPPPSADSDELTSARALGSARVRAQRAMTRRIRRTIAAGTVCTFLAVWLLIFGVLVSGHDPALGRDARHTAVSSTGTSSSPTTSGSSTDSGSSIESTTESGTSTDSDESASETSTSDSSESASGVSASEPATVSTRQS